MSLAAPVAQCLRKRTAQRSSHAQLAAVHTHPLCSYVPGGASSRGEEVACSQPPLLLLLLTPGLPGLQSHSARYTASVTEGAWESRQVDFACAERWLSQFLTDVTRFSLSPSCTGT